MMLRAPQALLVLAAAAFAAMPWDSGRAAEIAPAQRQVIESIIHDYLMKNPQVLIDALHAAEDKLKRDADATASRSVAEHRKEILDDPATPVAGNPKGGVSVVEFFDYRCPYCKEAEPSLDKLLTQDHQLRFVYKEFPILGPASVTAAHAALAAQRQGKYQAFHTAMMAARGNINDDTVYQVAGSVGLDVARLKRDMASPEVAEALKANLELADVLEIHGTPAFIIGNKVVPGVVDLDALQKMIADARKP